MERKDLIDLIIDYASDFAKKVKIQSELGYYDINTHAEHAIIPILNAVFDLNLINANRVKKNHTAIDLIDPENKVAFQVSATSTPDKVAETLEKFTKKKLHEQYPTLFIYILTEKKASYNTPTIRGIIKDKLDFDTGIHIIDYTDVLKRINFKTSVEVLYHIAHHYRQLTTSLLSLPRESKYLSGQILSYKERINRELATVIGDENINKIPELSELLSRVTIT